MRRPVKVLLVSGATLAVAVLSAACGTEKLSVPKSSPNYAGAVLFSQRCAGCHTLYAAGTHGSASNIRTRLVTNGPNFNVRCERPAIRVLYAIENGGFSGATMPQNIVVGQQAREVARFVSTYAGLKGSRGLGQATCAQLPIGTIPVASTTPTATTAAPTTTTASTTAAKSGGKAKKPGKAKKSTKAKKSAKAKKSTTKAATS